MSELQAAIHGAQDEQGVQDVCDAEAVPAEASAVIPVPTGWLCPCCKTIHSPNTAKCARCSSAYMIPRHILNAIESDLENSKNSVPKGTRIVRGSFVISYIEQMVAAVKRGPK